MSTCRWTGRPRSEWSASNRPIAPTIGPPAHFYVRDIGRPGSPRRLAEAIAKPNQACARAERNTRTASNDADIRPSLVRLGAQNGPQRRPFRAVPRRLPQQPDSLAERDGFEPSRPFISALQRAHERAEPKASRLIERLWAAAYVILKSGASQFRISRIDPPPPRTLDLWISVTLAGQDALPKQGSRITIEPGVRTGGATDTDWLVWELGR